MTRFDGKAVVITGAGNGLGRAHALGFARLGASVVVNDLGGSRDGAGGAHAAADAVVREIQALGGNAVANYDNVAARAGAEAIVACALERFGRIDVLVNNAGILRDKTLLKLTDEQWDAVIDVHLKGSFLCLQAAARAMVERKISGRIINTTSVAGLQGNFGQGNYGAAKAGIYGLTRVASLELQKFGITVNAIAPIAKTRLTEELEVVSADLRPEHVTPVVLFLASDAAAAVSGRIFGAHGRHVFEYRMLTSPGVEAKEDWTIESLAAALPRIEAMSPAPAGAASTTAAAPGASAPPQTDPAVAAPTTVPERVADVFRRMPAGFSAEAAGNWKAVMCFEIAGAGTFTVRVADGAAATLPRAEGTPTCVVKTDAATFLGMVDGSVDGQQAFMQGKITATNLGDLMKYRKVFSKDRAQAAPPSSSPSPAPAAGISAAPVVSAPPPASTAPVASAPPAELLEAWVQAIAELLPPRKSDESSMSVTLEIKGAPTRLLTWSAAGAEVTTLAAPPAGASRIRSTAEAFLDALADRRDRVSAAIDRLELVITRMADLEALRRGLVPDWQTRIARVIESRPVRVSPEARTRCFHGTPAVVTAADAAAYAEATGDARPGYERGETPPLLAVRYQHQLARMVLTDPGVSVDVLRLVHGEQEIRFHEPLRVGDVVSPKGQILGVEHKPSGSTITLRQTLWREGRLVNESLATYFVRGSGAGKSTRSADPTAATTASAATVASAVTGPSSERRFVVAADQSRRYATASLDDNPIHTDDGIARAAGFPSVILHGLCTLALSSRAVLDAVAGGQPERLRQIAGRFSRPVSAGDELSVRLRADAEGASERQVTFDVVNQRGELVLSQGRAIVGAPRTPTLSNRGATHERK